MAVFGSLLYIWFIFLLTYIIIDNDKKKKAREEEFEKHLIEEKKRAKEWRELVAVDKDELGTFRYNLWVDPDPPAEVEKRVNAVCAEIPGMENLMSISQTRHATNLQKDALVNIASMIYYAQFGKITVLWENGWVYGSSLRYAFWKENVSGTTMRLFFKWWQEELERNGFPYPEIDFIEPRHYDNEICCDEDLVPIAVYFVNGPEVPSLVRVRSNI